MRVKEVINKFGQAADHMEREGRVDNKWFEQMARNMEAHHAPLLVDYAQSGDVTTVVENMREGVDALNLIAANDSMAQNSEVKDLGRDGGLEVLGRAHVSGHMRTEYSGDMLFMAAANHKPAIQQAEHVFEHEGIHVATHEAAEAKGQNRAILSEKVEEYLTDSIAAEKSGMTDTYYLRTFKPAVDRVMRVCKRSLTYLKKIFLGGDFDELNGYIEDAGVTD